MADRNQLKMADQEHVAADDPFAELTRIMGFDPRQPVRPAASSRATPHLAPVPAAPADEDDFSMDLESELMGSFGMDEGLEPRREQGDPVLPPPSAWNDTDLQTSLDGEIETAVRSAILAQATPSAEPDEEAAPQGRSTPTAYDRIDEDALASEFDLALAEFESDDSGPAHFDSGLGGHRADRANPPIPETPLAAPDAHSGVSHTVSQPSRVSGDEELHLGDWAMPDREAPSGEPAAAVLEGTMPRVHEPRFADAFVARQASGASAGDRSGAPAYSPRSDGSAQTSEFNFEDELNALLGNFTKPKQPPGDSASSRLVERFRPSDDPVQIENEPREPEWMPEENFGAKQRKESVESSLRGHLAAPDARVAVDEESDASPSGWPVSGPASLPESDALDVDRRGAATIDAMEPADAEAVLAPGHRGVDDDLPDFDQDALDAAIARGFDLHVDPVAPEVARSPGLYLGGTAGRSDPLPETDALPAPHGGSAAAEPSLMGAPPAPDRARAHAGAGALHGRGDAFDMAPEVDTFEVADSAVALADDLDIPELNFEEDPPAASAYDDLDTEFEALLSELTGAEPVAAPAPAMNRGEPDAVPGGGAAIELAAAADHGDAAFEQGRYDFDVDDLPGSRPVQGEFEAGDYGYESEADQAIAPALSEEREPPRRRGLLVAGLVGAVALAGALGAFALNLGGGVGGDAPALVKADPGPIKVKPKNPGGTSVPNQDSKVYETVGGAKPEVPQQTKLVSTAEEPLDVEPPVPETAPRALDSLATPPGESAASAGAVPAEAEAAPSAAEEEAAAAGLKSEDRIEQILQEAEAADEDSRVAAIAPRKVRTMIVKPDGTLVPREDPAPAAALLPDEAPIAVAPETAPQTPAAALAPDAVAESPAPQVSAAPAAVEPAPSADPAAAAADPAAPAPLAPGTAPAEAAVSTAMPDSVPIAPTRPAEQPVEVIGEVKGDQVAALAPSAAATAGGSWSMQIASQPNEAAARSSYQDLARRYGNVLAGREVNIVKAEISGKGTFWRVRVPAKSRNDAISLCESYKAAGGNCFVSR